ncbi:CehA/McbA family metallohydrolase [Streptomyces sp. NBC_00503]|uniref:CehA/McbA family metallohydrolase n=1 Tax=Streptomyces sp. NBC_00503 TaxID=2903659 RepID=UPI002E80FFDE|nr:CehA/McbA family metallohydrolase [Streptomyces sp. NBC_00503]WUD79191.1 CehA/McbA family metallohydrolase [Streptomyces sp. NBC_00503]
MALSRRALLAQATAAATSAAPHSVTAAAAASEAEPTTTTTTLRGTIPPGAPDFVYVPLEVPPGIRELRVSYRYDKPATPPGTPGNALDIGLFDQRGTALGGRGFRGWSGGARSEFFLRADEATPGYLPGPLEPGRWHIALGPYTVAPQGVAYEITASLTFGEPAPAAPAHHPPERVPGRGRAWYRGDCHIHSVHSDGRRTPAEIAGLARAAGLDFINTSEHNTNSSHTDWSDAGAENLLVLTGEEITTRTGHVLAVGTDPGTFIDWRYRSRDGRFERFAGAVRQAGGLVVPAHPHANCIGCAWKFGFGEADAVEVWNGPWTPDDEVSLASWDATLRAARGDRWLPALAHSDYHRDPDRVGGPQTVVLADDLSRRAILAGLRAGRAYAAESSAVSVDFTAVTPRGGHAGIGERLRSDDPGTEVLVRLSVAGAEGCELRLVTDQGVVHTEAGATSLEWRTTPARSGYVRAEVRHPPQVPLLPGPPAAFTNPIWLGS